MRATFIFIPIYLFAFSALSQSARLHGKVTSEGEPVSYAAVELEGADVRKGTFTDAVGAYYFDKLNAGTYTLTVSSVGLRTRTQRFVLDGSQAMEINPEMLADRLNLDEVVVSGTRYALDRKESPVVVGVLDPRLLSAIQSTSLSEGLNFQPGLRVENNCQNCGFTQVRLNGLDGAYSQILINSRAVYSALNGVYGLDQIPANMIERIEIVRGGGSALYGSNAIGGTINIITKSPMKTPGKWPITSFLSWSVYRPCG